MKKLTPEQISKARELIKKLSGPKEPKKPALEPIYDDIYCQGLAWLNEPDSLPLDLPLSGIATIVPPEEDQDDN
jgi:hypothetical protein